MFPGNDQLLHASSIWLSVGAIQQPIFYSELNNALPISACEGFADQGKAVAQRLIRLLLIRVRTGQFGLSSMVRHLKLLKNFFTGSFAWALVTAGAVVSSLSGGFPPCWGV